MLVIWKLRVTYMGVTIKIMKWLGLDKGFDQHAKSQFSIHILNYAKEPVIGKSDLLYIEMYDNEENETEYEIHDKNVI